MTLLDWLAIIGAAVLHLVPFGVAVASLRTAVRLYQYGREEGYL